MNKEKTTPIQLGIRYATRLRRACVQGDGSARKELKEIGVDLASWVVNSTGIPISRSMKEKILENAGEALGLADPLQVIYAFDEADDSTVELSNSAYVQMVAQISALVKSIKK